MSKTNNIAMRAKMDRRAGQKSARRSAPLLVALLLFVCARSEGAGRRHAVAEKSIATEASAAPNAQLADPALNVRVEDLLRKMTLEEKIGQLAQYSAGAATGPEAAAAKYEDEIQRGQVGSLLNVVGFEQANHYQHVAVEKSRLHIPLLFGLDVIHGYRTIFPIPLGLAAGFDPALVESVARTSAAESRADGVNWVFSPMVDIARDARWGRTAESAGEDPYLGSALARAWVRGYQQGDLRNPTSVAASVKHFAAYGAAVAGRDYNAVDMSDQQLRQVYLEPYRAAIDEGAATVMSSFNSLNGVPATANPYTLTQILRGEWRFQGFVVSDWGAVRELLAHSIAADGATAARKALTAGVDMDMESDLYRTRLAAMVQSGQVPEAAVNEAAKRILRVKFAMGLFEHPYTQVPVGIDAAAVSASTAEKRRSARSVAAETLVLLKNDGVEGYGKLLPMKKDLRNVALIGPLADSAADMLGSWSGQGQAADVVTLKSALEHRFASSNTTLTYVKGTEILTESETGFDAAVRAAKQAQLVVMALGESGPEMTGEAASRAHIDLPGNQEQLLEAVVAAGKPVVLVIFSGRPIALPWAAKHVPAIIEAWFPGVEAGNAIADVLSGDVNPSGRLPVSFPYSVGQEPLYYAQLPTGRPATGDLTRPPGSSEERFLSRYLDEPNAALFPFGWGLSYTRFQYSGLTVDRNQVAVSVADQAGANSSVVIKVGVEVKNTGVTAGTEVVQLYLRNTDASVEQPVRELKGFKRVVLAGGAQQHVEFLLGFNELAFYNAQSLRRVEPAKYTIWVGGDSLATDSTQFEVTQ